MNLLRNNLCGKSILSDFNVIRREVGYMVNGNTDSAFLQDVYTLLEANGYGAYIQKRFVACRLGNEMGR